ncbi:MAG: acetolactate decarboxylase [Bacteroidia bacterium]
MKQFFLSVFLLFNFLLSAQNPTANIVGNIFDVKWKGQLGSAIKFDTLNNRSTLYGMGPGAYLRGEVFIIDGECYTASVLDEDYMDIEKGFYGGSPFFVYGNVNKWQTVKLPSKVKDLKQLELFLTSRSKKLKQPFLFRLEGRIDMAKFYVGNLTRGTLVSNPQDAERNSTIYKIYDKKVDILGVYTNQHKDVLFLDESLIYLQLITADKTKIGYIKDLKINPKKLILLLPVE